MSYDVFAVLSECVKVTNTSPQQPKFTTQLQSRNRVVGSLSKLVSLICCRCFVRLLRTQGVDGPTSDCPCVFQTWMLHL